MVSGLELSQPNTGVATPKVDLQLLRGRRRPGPHRHRPDHGRLRARQLSMDPALGFGTALVNVVSDDFPTLPISPTISSRSARATATTSTMAPPRRRIRHRHRQQLQRRARSGPSDGIAGALLQAYPNIGAGDTVFVDTGDYTLATNVVIGAAHSGLTIQGPLDQPIRPFSIAPTSTVAQYGIELQNAAHVTLDHLTVTGG